ncbi:uncharacterized protein LOC121238249 [Juglans microcarpa x Juglans regia]|uniref:uncharacterized protein LOC121238249 n=1 Tax=Juglans microcarpa x Juglans regia TaxID=2249226 RepID=UPI001B7F32F5|nr:uncharacterized protein LOC121238249 [Juglans microcarpa x Juglans regia]
MVNHQAKNGVIKEDHRGIQTRPTSPRLNPQISNIKKIPKIWLSSIRKRLRNSGDFWDHLRSLLVHVLLHSQDQDSGKRTALAREKDGLYYREESGISNIVRNKLSLSLLSSSNRDTIWLHHFRLGHPSFGVLKTMFLHCLKG